MPAKKTWTPTQVAALKARLRVSLGESTSSDVTGTEITAMMADVRSIKATGYTKAEMLEAVTTGLALAAASALMSGGDGIISTDLVAQLTVDALEMSAERRNAGG